MRKKGTPQPIESFLGQFLKQRGWDTKLHEYKIWTHWESLVGRQLAQKSKPLSLRNGILTIGVSQSVWITQLQFMKPQIIEKIQKTLHLTLRDIRLSFHPN